MEIRIIWMVGFGGFLGSVARYLLGNYFAKTILSAFPYGTFVVNVAGCLLIGFFYGLSEKFSWLTPEWRIFLTTGFCGGFTTFSAFAIENIFLLQTTEILTAVFYVLLSLMFGLLATYSGLMLARLL